MLKPWSIDADLDKMQDFYYPMWVQFSNLRLNLWSSIGISKVASLIGNPISTDKLTATRQRLSYARVLLEVKLPLKEPLPDQFNIQGLDGTSYTQTVIYEFKPKWCSLCSKIGHDIEQCRRIKTKKIWVPVIRQAAQVTAIPELVKESDVIPELDKETSVRQGYIACINIGPIEHDVEKVVLLQVYSSTPIVNAFGFSSINRANLARRASIANPEFSVQEITSTEQYITCSINSRDGKFSSLCTIVYALNQMTNMRILWRDLLTFKNNVNGPWIIGGDFIAITSYDEKIGDAEARIWSRLDRYLVNEDWIHLYTISQVEYLLPSCSDHSPALLAIEDYVIEVSTNNPEPVVISNGPLLSYDQRHALSLPVTRNEIKQVIFSMPNDKSPGLDGYSALFFKTSWSVISEELFSAVE
ncbi:uncharacterized protein LOC109837705 [Asparagus officinalis]|uniref:uncharacterized protein LOC109837705 n=1 Tax=Asparagus officinalis TaxID=4686 RepID=UPI00098E767C|nr:uncharacterized protein LOC109837705 [Asparagus officinalis]